METIVTFHVCFRKQPGVKFTRYVYFRYICEFVFTLCLLVTYMVTLKVLFKEFVL